MTMEAEDSIVEYEYEYEIHEGHRKVTEVSEQRLHRKITMG